jgi:hypothetical protein
VNIYEYLKETENNPNIVQSVQSLPLTLVKINQTIGQARVTGHIQSHVDALATDIEAQGQLVPITVESIAGKGFLTIDGNHRIEALKALGKLHPENAKFKMVTAIVKKFNSDAERMKYQAKANEHLPARKNMKGDIAYHIRRLQHEGDPAVPMPPAQTSQHSKYAKDLRAYIMGEYTISPREATAVINDLTSILVNQKLQNITKDNLENMFVSWNKLNWGGRADNKTATGWNVYTSPTHGGAYPNKSVVSYSFKSKSAAAPGTAHNAVVVWDNNPLGKDEKRIDEYRENVVESWNNANSSHLLKRGKKLVDKIFIAPQKLGANCTEVNFFEVEVKNNKFDSKTIPKNGWVN